MPIDALHTDQGGLLACLQHLMRLPALDLRSALTDVAELLVTEVQADNVDVFLYEAATDSLEVYGISPTPLGHHQLALGLDRVPLSGGGRMKEVFQSGQSYLTGRADRDAGVLRAVREELGVRSLMLVPLMLDAKAWGVLQAASTHTDYFSPETLAFFEAVAQWVGLVGHRATLAEQVLAAELRQARRSTAEELLTFLAHDLKNYLMPLKGRLTLLQRRIEGRGHTEHLPDVAASQNALTLLTALTDSLLNVSRLDRGTFAPSRQRVDLVALTRELAAVLSVGAAQIHLSAPPSLYAEVDAERFQQALANLLVNALRHSPSGTPVQVEIAEEARGTEGWAIIAVRNEGEAIDPLFLPHVFERFVSTLGSSGLGIGLYMAQQITQAHGGTLEVQSESGEGTVFRLTLPCSQEAPR